MRLVVLLALTATHLMAAVSALLDEALHEFRPDPPRGWSYTLTTVAEGHSTVEYHDASKPEFERWSLIRKDGNVPTDEEKRKYAEMRSRRSRGGTAPKITDQLDVTSIATIGETAERVLFRAGLRPGDRTDRTAAFLRVTISVDRRTRTVDAVELASRGEFRPAIGVKIAELKTILTYTPPDGERPAFPRSVTTHVRGRAFWFKSLDADMTVTYSDYAKPMRKK